MEFKDIRNFIEGNYNHLKNEFNLLDDETKTLADKRIKICQSCIISKGEHKGKPGLENNKCRLCGCSYPSLTFAPDKECPDKKW